MKAIHCRRFKAAYQLLAFGVFCLGFLSMTARADLMEHGLSDNQKDAIKKSFPKKFIYDPKKPPIQLGRLVYCSPYCEEIAKVYASDPKQFQDGIDDCFDITGTSDNVTVSWCKFTHLKPAKAGGSGGSADHRYSNLIGGSDTDKPSDGHYSITWQNCWWADGNKDRMVRGRNVQLHILNCYWSSQEASNNISLTAGDMGCTCYVEGGIFVCTGKQAIMDIPRNTDGTPKTPYPTVPFNLKFVDCFKADGTIPTTSLTGGASNPATLSAPTYAYTVYPSSMVVAAVTNPTCGAGATLQVTTQGLLSTVCGLSGVIEYKESKLRCYPTMVEDMLNIDFTEAGDGNTNINIYSVNGQNVLSVSKRIYSTETMKLNLVKLNPGIYFVNIQDKKSNSTHKFVKN